MAQQTVNSLKKKAFGVVTALAIIFSASVDAQEISGKCVTPDSLEGECVVVRNCPYLLDKLKPPLTQDGIDSLRRFQCGFQENQPFVCCPKEISSTVHPISINEHPNVRLLPVDACGHGQENAIITNKASIYEVPWLALLGYVGTGNGTKFRCSGVIINEKYILTAAHCITHLPDELKLSSVRLGEQNLASNIDCEGDESLKECLPPPQDMEIEELIPHPEFDKKIIQNDIGLIRLKTAINISEEGKTPICVPLDEKAIKLTQRMKIAGWGITKEGESSTELLTASVGLLDSGECAETYKKFVNIYANKQLCVSPEYGSHRSCIGDSGGPLMGFGGERSRYFVKGIMSFGVSVCRTSDYPRVYTLVEYYARWILDNLKP